MKQKLSVKSETLTDGSTVYNVVDGGGECVACPPTAQEAQAICDSLNAVKADRPAIAMGAEDKRVNNVDPQYRGKVTVNGQTLDVINSAVFNGIIHWGLCGYIDVPNKEAVVGWIPACLCNIP